MLYIANISASNPLGTYSIFAIAFSIADCRLGTWTSLDKGLTFSTKVCHNWRMCSAEGCEGDMGRLFEPRTYSKS